MEKPTFYSESYFINNEGCFERIKAKNKYDEDKVIRLSSPIIIKNKFLDPSKGIEKLTITDGQNIERIETSDILTSQKLPGLVMYGFSINEKYIKSLSHALQLMRQSLPLSSLHTGVGVLNTDNGIVISLDELYLSNEVKQSQADEIICETQYDLQPKGTFEGWRQMYLNEVKGNLLLELAVTFGISALVSAFLKNKHEVEFAGIIFSFTGHSSTGKSTAAALAVSVGGNPSKGQETLFRSWNATRNALEGYLSHNYGVPIVFDELSSATFRDTTGLLYSIAEGQGRQRSNVHGEVKTPKNWGTSVISTSEYSIFTDSAQNDGLRVRTIEVSEQFTTDATNSDNIKKSVVQNYGHVLPLVAEHLIEHEEEVIHWFQKEHAWFNETLKAETNNTGIRMFKRYAAITTSARIQSHVLSVEMDIDKIRNYFVEYHFNTVCDRSLSDKAIEVITQFVAQNRGKFSDEGALKNMFENYGLISLRDDHIEVKIIANVFKNMLQEHNFQDVNNVVSALKDKGFISSDSGRQTTKRSVKDNSGKKKTLVFYHLKLDKELTPIFDLNSDLEPLTSKQFDGHTNKLLDDFVKKARENDDLAL